MKKILIVEDEESHRLLLKKYLEKLFPSFEIIERVNGKLALDYCLTNGSIDLLLVDIRMPEMNGFEFIKKYREHGGSSIAIATTAIFLDNQTAWEDFQGVIIKPLRMEKLKQELEKFL